MADEKSLMKARQIFDFVCDMLDEDDWNYTKDEEGLAIETGARGEDLPIEFIIRVDAERNMILLLSQLPVTVKEDKLLDMSVAVSIANYGLVDGSFDYNIVSGKIYFRMTNSFIDSTVSKDLIMYLILCSCKTIDDYNDKFLMLSNGTISLEKFIESEQ